MKTVMHSQYTILSFILTEVQINLHGHQVSVHHQQGGIMICINKQWTCFRFCWSQWTPGCLGNYG